MQQVSTADSMISIRQLTLDDIPFCMSLKDQAGWNQLAQDWRRFLALAPGSAFQANWNGKPAGTVVVCQFGPVAWICMMLVEESLRGKGLGRALMTQAIECADALQVRSLRLDATPMGHPLYESLGFKDDFPLTRFAGILKGGSATPSIKSVTIDQASQFDERITRTSRRQLIELMAQDAPLVGIVENDQVRGFLTSRPGSRATQIGPCIADEEAGPLLLADAFRRLQGQLVYIDIPQSHAAATRMAEDQGLTSQRSLLRMTRGETLVEDVRWLWASSGPEKG